MTIKSIATWLPITALLVTTTHVYAVVSSPSATPDNAKQIQDLKERLATKVAELKKTEKKATFGKVKSVSVSSVTIETKIKDLKIELPDEVVVIQYLKGQRTKLATSDITKGDSIAVLGSYDSTVDIMKASVIIIQDTIMTRISGSITAIDKTEYTLTITGSDGQSHVIDIETTTKAVTWDPTNGITKYGFSKMVVGDLIQVLGTPNAKTSNRMSAIRILDLVSLSAKPAATGTPSVSPASSASATPQKTQTPVQ